MQKIELEIDDFISYCDYKNLSKKKLASYEQTLRLFIRYLKDGNENKQCGCHHFTYTVYAVRMEVVLWKRY